MKTTKRTTRRESTHAVETTTTVETIEEDVSCTPARGWGAPSSAGSHRLPHPSRGPTTVAWTHLKGFKIEYPPAAGVGGVPQVKVFANGAQQVRVRVRLSPRDANGDYVEVPCEELRSQLTLVHYGTGLPLSGPWIVRDEANEYVLDHSFISDAPVKKGERAKVYSENDNRAEGCDHGSDFVAFDVYVAANSIGSVQIAASILPPNSSQPYQTRPGASGGEFDSSVNVDARPPLDLAVTDFCTIETGRGAAVNGWVATNHFISATFNGRKVQLLRVEPKKAGEERLNVFIDTGEHDSWEAMFTICQKEYDPNGWTYSSAYVPDMIGGENTSYHNSACFQNPPISGQRRGDILYVRHMTKMNMHFYWGTADAGDVIQQQVYFVDIFGNRHPVTVGATSYDTYQYFIGVVGKW